MLRKKGRVMDREVRGRDEVMGSGLGRRERGGEE